MTKKTFPPLLYILRNSLQFYASGQDKPYVLDFDTEAVSDLEVKKINLLNDSVRLFIEQNKIPATPFVTILAPEIYLEKTFAQGTGETNKDEINKFLELVPFENIKSKTYPKDKGLKIYAVNIDFYEIIESAFEKFGFRAETTVPLTMLGSEMNDSVFNKIGLAKQYSISGQASFTRLDHEKEMTLRKNKRLLLMLGVLVILIGFLAAMLIITLRPVKKAIVLPAVVKEAVVEETDNRLAIPAASLAVDQIKVKIQNGSGISGAAGNTREIFKTLGFTEITVGNISGLVGQSSVVYSSSVSAQLLDKVMTTLKTTYPTITSLQGADGEFGIVFTLGKNTSVKTAP